MRRVLNPLLVGLVGLRDEAKCSYSSATLFWTVIFGFFQHMRSRNQMDMTRNDRAYSQTVFELSGQPYDPDDPKLHTACSQTCRNHLAHVETARLEQALVGLVRHLVRGKWFEDARLWGCLCVAVDGTLCERKRGSSLSDREKRRHALEARIVTPWGWNIPVMSEPVAAYDGEREKQDCERKAFVRLAARLKKAFPHLGICIVGDALYACGPVMDLCRGYGWEFLLTFKEGSMPKVWKDVCDAQLRTGGRDWVRRKDEDGGDVTCGVVAWIDAREMSYESGDGGVDFRVVKYFCWDPVEGAYDGAFVTSFEVGNRDRAVKVVEWGRRRWNVENGFKVEKHDGFGLEHTFCNDDTAGRNYHVLMEIAYALWQVFATGVIPRLAEGCRKMPQSGWAAVIWIATHVIGFRDLPVESVGTMRMRRFHLVA